MFATLFSVTLFVALAVQGVLADFEIYTPTLTQCQQTQISWTQATAPYNLVIVPGDDVCGDALEDLGSISALSLNYTVNLAAGTVVVLFVEDSAGDEAWSGEITIGASSDSSCLSSTSGTSTSGSASSPSASASGTPFAPAGAANAGINPLSSGALSTRSLGLISMVGSAAAALVAFAM
ncbi:hypothetical protein BJ138DRAFT_1003640 [Hygrophoropsis aurantiaca]|uniref:Uncharacterized protein n=1 Tax=Hygrophoropsis aurantiaca TaxID=72124 RepID=A0ACB8AHY8_9AGAM|nr:hypothetical protein BJ138DRAFT_1003640 [Hygrophoropsis aurantiaca]